MIKIVTAFTLIMWTSNSNSVITYVPGIKNEAECIKAKEFWYQQAKGWIKSVCVSTLVPAIQEGTGQ